MLTPRDAIGGSIATHADEAQANAVAAAMSHRTNVYIHQALDCFYPWSRSMAAESPQKSKRATT
jgi:hypothetical protein